MLPRSSVPRMSRTISARCSKPPCTIAGPLPEGSERRAGRRHGRARSRSMPRSRRSGRASRSSLGVPTATDGRVDDRPRRHRLPGARPPPGPSPGRCDELHAHSPTSVASGLDPHQPPGTQPSGFLPERDSAGSGRSRGFTAPPGGLVGCPAPQFSKVVLVVPATPLSPLSRSRAMSRSRQIPKSGQVVGGGQALRPPRRAPASAGASQISMRENDAGHDHVAVEAGELAQVAAGSRTRPCLSGVISRAPAKKARAAWSSVLPPLRRLPHPLGHVLELLRRDTRTDSRPCPLVTYAPVRELVPVLRREDHPPLRVQGVLVLPRNIRDIPLPRWSSCHHLGPGRRSPDHHFAPPYAPLPHSSTPSRPTFTRTSRSRTCTTASVAGPRDRGPPRRDVGTRRTPHEALTSSRRVAASGARASRVARPTRVAAEPAADAPALERERGASTRSRRASRRDAGSRRGTRRRRGGTAPRRGRSSRRWRRARGWRGAPAGGGGAAGRPRRGGGPPCGRCTTGTRPPRSPSVWVPPRERGTTWSMFSAAAVAVLAAVAVTGEHGPARQRHPVAVRHPHEVVEADHRRARARQRARSGARRRCARRSRPSPSARARPPGASARRRAARSWR